MQLVYRGSMYTSASDSIEMCETAITGRYRGVAIAFRAPLRATQPQAIATLTYRGVPYLRVREC